MSYYVESLKPASEKITLVTCESVERLKIFTQNASDWDKAVEHFVVGVKDAGTVITSWTFEPTTKTLKILGGADPKTRDISVTYRHFFSNTPVNLPYDLNNGEVVEWEPYISSIGSIGQQLDDENTGIVLESSSSVDFINTDGRFDGIFDTLIWENQNIRFYSWFPNIPASESVQLFSGVIESKSFSDSVVSFKVKDFVYRLKNKLNLGLFSDSDGTLLPSLIGTAKRRIYGQADYVKTASLDATLDGHTLSGDISGSVSTDLITGNGTSFLDEVSPGDEIFASVNGTNYKIGVQSVDSNTQVTSSSALPISFQNVTAKNKPATPWRKKNRRWHLANHKLRSPHAEILSIVSLNQFEVDSTVDMLAGDEIEINGVPSTIRRISGNTIVTSTNIVPAPSISDLITKRAVRNVYYGDRRLEYARDYTFVNTTEAIIEIEDLAEFNITEQRLLNISLSFTSGSRSITTSDTVDLKATLKPRDWIRAEDPSKSTWYEILEVEEQSIKIRTPFSSSSGIHTAYYKGVSVIDENSQVTASCIGMEVDGAWMKTASDCVRHLILNDAGLDSVDEASFAKAKSDSSYIVSLVVPDQLGQGYPIIRDIISRINESVLAVLYGNSSQQIAYSIFNTRKPSSFNVLRDDDIISFSSESSQKISNEARIQYSPYVDIFSQENTFRVVTETSSFVNNLIGIKSSLQKTVYLYEETKAKIVAQRLLFFRSLSNSVIRIQAKMNLSTINVNDKIYISFDRLFKRYSSRDNRKIGVVSGVKKNGLSTEISISDLSNCFNRVMCIAGSSTLDFLNATEDDKISYCFIVDAQSKTPDATSEDGLGSNLIG